MDLFIGDKVRVIETGEIGRITGMARFNGTDSYEVNYKKEYKASQLVLIEREILDKIKRNKEILECELESIICNSVFKFKKENNVDVRNIYVDIQRECIELECSDKLIAESCGVKVRLDIMI